jgi:uncharacterized protein (DUF2147 family)
MISLVGEFNLEPKYNHLLETFQSKDFSDKLSETINSLQNNFLNKSTEEPKTDTKHPNNKLHTRPLMGLINLWGFSFNDNEGNWDNGHIYDPKTGKEYKCTIKAKDKNSLDVRGYIGISLIGRTDTWTRVKS